jgi:hypothetical protein
VRQNDRDHRVQHVRLPDGIADASTNYCLTDSGADARTNT